MKLKKITAVLFCLVIVFTFAACGGSDDTKTKDGGTLLDEAKAGFADNIGELATGAVGDTLSNSFFEWTLNSVETVDEHQGKTAKDGYQFVVANISMKNKVDYAFATGNFEFSGIFEASNEGLLDTLSKYYDGMIPDEVELGAGETLKGDLVFEVAKDVEELILDYQEYYEDGSVGNTNWFCLKL